MKIAGLWKSSPHISNGWFEIWLLLSSDWSDDIIPVTSQPHKSNMRYYLFVTEVYLSVHLATFANSA